MLCSNINSQTFEVKRHVDNLFKCFKKLLLYLKYIMNFD